MTVAVRHNLSVYDACYLQVARFEGLPLASNDHALLEAAVASGIEVIRP